MLQRIVWVEGEEPDHFILSRGYLMAVMPCSYSVEMTRYAPA